MDNHAVEMSDGDLLQSLLWFAKNAIKADAISVERIESESGWFNRFKARRFYHGYHRDWIFDFRSNILIGMSNTGDIEEPKLGQNRPD